MQTECTRSGYFLFLTETADNPDHQFEAIRELHQGRVDGIVLAPVPDQRLTQAYQNATTRGRVAATQERKRARIRTSTRSGARGASLSDPLLLEKHFGCSNSEVAMEPGLHDAIVQQIQTS